MNKLTKIGLIIAPFIVAGLLVEHMLPITDSSDKEALVVDLMTVSYYTGCMEGVTIATGNTGVIDIHNEACIIASDRFKTLLEE